MDEPSFALIHPGRNTQPPVGLSRGLADTYLLPDAVDEKMTNARGAVRRWCGLTSVSHVSSAVIQYLTLRQSRSCLPTDGG